MLKNSSAAFAAELFLQEIALQGFRWAASKARDNSEIPYVSSIFAPKQVRVQK